MYLTAPLCRKKVKIYTQKLNNKFVGKCTVLKKGYLTSCPRIVRAANDPR